MKKKTITAAGLMSAPFMLHAEELSLESIVHGFSVNLFALLGGIIPGLVLSIKFAVEMIKTYYAREQNPEAFKSAIIKFSIAVFAVVNLSIITLLVFGQKVPKFE